jgi:hypothetical protein
MLACGSIQEMTMRLQTAFLDTPALMLTPSQAARRFGIDAGAAAAILEALADAGVLQQLDGSYLRYYPLRHLESRTGAAA